MGNEEQEGSGLMSATRVVPDSIPTNIHSLSFLPNPGPEPPRTILPPNGAICTATKFRDASGSANGPVRNSEAASGEDEYLPVALQEAVKVVGCRPESLQGNASDPSSVCGPHICHLRQKYEPDVDCGLPTNEIPPFTRQGHICTADIVLAPGFDLFCPRGLPVGGPQLEVADEIVEGATHYDHDITVELEKFDRTIARRVNLIYDIGSSCT